MHALTLRWAEKGQQKTETIQDQQPSKNPGTVRIGRDPSRCDIVLSDLTVSGLHVEIYFNSQSQSFYLRSLRPSNPPVVDGHSLFQGEVPLGQGSVIYLGQMQLSVVAVSVGVGGIAPTQVISPQALRGVTQRPPIVPQVQQVAAITPQVSATPTGSLQCPHCHRLCPPEDLILGCRWCGTSLAAAVSVLASPYS